MSDKSIYEDYFNSDFNTHKEFKVEAIIITLFINSILIWGSILVLIDQGVSAGTLFVSSVILSLVVYLDYTICKNTRYVLKKEESKREWITREGI